MNYNFAVVSPKLEILAEFKEQPVVPQKGDLLVINKHPMKVVKWVHDYDDETCGFSVMVVRDLDFDPYTQQEVRERLESGETFTDKRGKCWWRLKKDDNGNWINSSFEIETAKTAKRVLGKDRDITNEQAFDELVSHITRGMYGMRFTTDVFPIKV